MASPSAKSVSAVLLAVAALALAAVLLMPAGGAEDGAVAAVSQRRLAAESGAVPAAAGSPAEATETAAPPAEAAPAPSAPAAATSPQRLRGGAAEDERGSEAQPGKTGPSTNASVAHTGTNSSAAHTAEGDTNSSATHVAEGGGEECLCVFDIDRTLTGKQGRGPPRCPNNEVRWGVWDDAYGGGDLTLSGLGRSGLGGTPCSGCRIGIVSHGTAGGNRMKEVIRSVIGASSDYWSTPHHIHSPLVLGCADKPPCVQGVMDWYNRHGGAISPHRVYMFDDKRSNVEAFYGSPFNAIQISCAGMDGNKGYCGAEKDEVRLSGGVSTC